MLFVDSFYVNMLICTLSLGRQAETFLRVFSVKKYIVSTQLGENYKKDPFLSNYYTKSVVTAFRYHSDLELLYFF